MELWIDMIGLALFANWLTHWFTPLDSIREKLVTKMINNLVRVKAFWALGVVSVFTCAYCLAFWASLLYFQNFTYALITSFLALSFRYIIKKHNEIV